MAEKSNTILSRSVVSILNKNGSIIGAGFLVKGGIILTCAHIVVSAGGNLDDSVQVKFLDEQYIIETKIIAIGNSSQPDLAILQPIDIISNRQELPVETQLDSAGHSFTTLGFYSEGYLFATGRIRGTISKDGFELLQLSSEEITVGFSGAPVWDEEINKVVGIITSRLSRDENRSSDVLFAITTDEIKRFYPSLKTFVSATINFSLTTNPSPKKIEESSLNVDQPNLVDAEPSNFLEDIKL